MAQIGPKVLRITSGDQEDPGRVLPDPGGPKKDPRGPRRSQEGQGGPRKAQEGPGGPRRAQAGPGGPRKAQEGPGRPRREDPGRRKEKQSCWLVTTHASSFKQRDKLATKQANKPADNTNNKNKQFQSPENKYNNHYNLNTETHAKRTQTCNGIKTKTQ